MVEIYNFQRMLAAFLSGEVNPPPPQEMVCISGHDMEIICVCMLNLDSTTSRQ